VGGVAEDSHHQDTVQSLQYEIELLKTRISQEREKLKVPFILKHKGQTQGNSCLVTRSQSNSRKQMFTKFKGVSRRREKLRILLFMKGERATQNHNTVKGNTKISQD
jgi:hypothetical protein